MISSLHAGGMTIRDIGHHLVTTQGTELSHETISKIVDEISKEVLAWQRRPLESFYPVIYLDAIVVKVRDGAHVTNKSAHLAVGVDMDGFKHVLGIWVQTPEGAKFWAGGGIRDVLIVYCDGLTGLPEAIEATWTQTTVQTCVVHLIRASMRFVGYDDRKSRRRPRSARSAPRSTPEQPVESSRFRRRVGHEVRPNGRYLGSGLGTVHPFLAFPPELRRVIYTTNSIESPNYQLRKIIKNRGHFPNDAAVVKLLWLATCNIEDKRAPQARQRAREARSERRAKPALLEDRS